MKKKTLAVVVGLAVAIGGGAWFANKGPAEQGAAQAQGNGGGGKGKGEQGPTTVNVVAPLRQDVPVALSANGTVSPISTPCWTVYAPTPPTPARKST